MPSLYSIEKSLEKRVSFHSYTVKFKYVPKYLTLYGSNNHLSWFILDEVLEFSEITKNTLYILKRNINNNSYFRFFKVEAEIYLSQNDQIMEILFDESDSDDSPFYKITESSFSVQINNSIHDYSKTIGLLESLIINNFHMFITTHRCDDLNQNNNSTQNYSIFSNYIHPKEDLKTLDPRPKGKHEFIFHSFVLHVNSIFSKINENNTIFFIEYLDSNKNWKPLIHTKSLTSPYSLNDKVIHGIRFDTTAFNFNNFDFFGTIQFAKKAEIIPSSYSGFPFWGSNLNGIINAIKQYTNVDATSSGLFEAVGQYDIRDDSQKSFLKEMYTVFEEFNEETSSLTFRFGFKICLSNYLIQVPERSSNERNRNPHKWKLEGSNDEITWTLLSEIEDNIFDTDVEAVVYRATDTSNYFSSFRIVKFDDCRGYDNVQFNQLILYQIEFFGLISPFYSSPSFFWELPITHDYDEDSPYSYFEKNSSVQPIIPIDLCNGIIGSLNYFGSSLNLTENILNFNNFLVSVSAIALINPPNDLKIILSSKNHLSKINFNETNPIYINENVVFIKLQKIKYKISKIALSKKVDGIELFGFISNNFDDEPFIKPGKSFEYEFPLNFKYDILYSLIISEFIDFDFKSNIDTSFVSIKATEPLVIQNLPCQIIESKNDKFILFDFIDSRLSLNFFAICCEKLESLKLMGSNDNGKTYENVLDFKQIHQNHDLKLFIIQSKNKKSFQLFKLEKTKSYKEIENVKFYGNLELIKPKMRKPRKIKILENFLILPGLDSQNGILHAFKDFPLEKLKGKNIFTIDFIEISIIIEYFSLINFNESNTANYLKIEGLDNKNEWITLYNMNKNDENMNGDDFFPIENENAVSIVKISTDDKNFDFDRIEFFGEVIISRPNPIRKKPPNFDFMLNPFNGILNSGLFEYKQTTHFHYISIEFKDILIFAKEIFLEFNDSLKIDFFIEASIDSLNWTEIDFDLNKASPKKYECSIKNRKGYQFFHIYSKLNIQLTKVEFFGKVQKYIKKEQSDFDKKIFDELSSEKIANFSYNDSHPFNGIFYSINRFFNSLSIPLSSKGTKGNEENAISLFDTFSNEIVSFTSTTNNVICISLKLAKIKLTKYLIYFGPDLLLNSNLNKWKLEASNDMKKWIEIDSSTDKEMNEIETFDVSNDNFFYHFRFCFKNPIVLRKIEFFGDYLPKSQEESFAIVKDQPIMLRKDRFSGILSSMCKITNAFEKGLIETSPPNLSKLINNKQVEPVTINSSASFDFINSELKLSYYSIETTMKSWKVEVNSLDDEKWIEIDSQTGFQNCSTFKISNCPNFSKIRFINNDKQPRKLKRIEFFGLIEDKLQTKSYRYDIMNGILSLLAPQPNTVFNSEITVKSSNYKYTNPIQIFDRNHINRVFCFTPTSKENENDSPIAFLLLEFWKKAIKIDNYAFILLQNSKIKNLKIEGKTSLKSDKDSSNWEEIGFLNENEIKENNFLFKNSKSSQFFHFIRISSTEEFSFENVEFFGDYKIELISSSDDEEDQNDDNLELDDKDIIARFPFTPIKSSNKALKNGFFHNEKTNTFGFVKIFSSTTAKNSSPFLSIFENNEKGTVIFDKKDPKIQLEFLTTSFQLTHFLIEVQSDVNIELTADGKTVFNGKIPGKTSLDDDQVSITDIIPINIIDPAMNFLFDFKSDKNLKINFFEIYGNLVPNNNSPDHLISLGLNRISLSFKNSDRLQKNFSLMSDRLKLDLFKNGILSSIAKNNGGTLNDNSIVSVFERYPEIEKSAVKACLSSPSEFAFGNSPQTTFDFGKSRIKLSDYALDSKMRSWIVEGSNDGGESWFVIDEQNYKKEDEERPKYSSPRFSRRRDGNKNTKEASTASSQTIEKIKQMLFHIRNESKNKEVSMIRITNMDSLFEGFYDTSLFYKKKSRSNESRYSCGIGRIEFYGDIDVQLQKKKKDEEKSINDNEENIDYDYYDEDDSEDENEFKKCQPLKNLIFFPPFSVPNLQIDEKQTAEKKNENENDYSYNDYDYEFEEDFEDPESDDDENVSSSSSDNANSDMNLNLLDFTDMSIADILRLFRIMHNSGQNSDDLDIDFDLSD